MRQVVVICCLCERVRDDRGVETGQEAWQDFRGYFEKYMLKLRDVSLSHEYCPSCLGYYRNFLTGLDTAKVRSEKERNA